MLPTAMSISLALLLPVAFFAFIGAIMTFAIVVSAYMEHSVRTHEKKQFLDGQIPQPGLPAGWPTPGEPVKKSSYHWEGPPLDPRIEAAIRDEDPGVFTEGGEQVASEILPFEVFEDAEPKDRLDRRAKLFQLYPAELVDNLRVIMLTVGGQKLLGPYIDQIVPGGKEGVTVDDMGRRDYDKVVVSFERWVSPIHAAYSGFALVQYDPVDQCWYVIEHVPFDSPYQLDKGGLALGDRTFHKEPAIA